MRIPDSALDMILQTLVPAKVCVLWRVVMESNLGSSRPAIDLRYSYYPKE